MTSKAASLSFQYPRFTKFNYDSWALRMKIILSSKGVWEVAEKGFAMPEDEAALYSKREGRFGEGTKKRSMGTHDHLSRFG